MDDDFDASLGRVVASEEKRAQIAGFGTTLQGQAIGRLYRESLAKRIDDDRRRRPVKTKSKDLAPQLIASGLSVCAGEALGTDRYGRKNFRDQALFIGRNLGLRGEAAFRAGAWSIDMLQGLEIFDLADDATLVLPLTDHLDAFLDEVIAREVRQSPLLSPLTTPPVPWTQVRKGGLPADHWAKVSLVRGSKTEAVVRHAITTGKMQLVLDAINALQRVAFTINEPVLNFLRQREPIGRQLDITTADAMLCAGRFYVPLTMDFRGRLYPISYFSFLRDDSVRALFLFADGEPIGDEGLNYLKAHVAKCADGNKWSRVAKPSDLNLEGRIAWAEENLQELRKIGETVLRDDGPATVEWALPKDPYQFVAACVELVRALDEGPSFATRLPMTFDGTCSGLQHLCGMTRAEEGRFVNIKPGEDMDDFYRRVAYKTYMFDGHPDQLIAPLMQGPMDREIVKQPAMSFFYGARPGSCYIKSKKKQWEWAPWGMAAQVVRVMKDRNRPLNHAGDLAHAIYHSVEDTVPKAKAVRDFLEHLVTGTPLRWTTPLGLPIINLYREPDVITISTMLNGRRKQTNLTIGDKDKPDKMAATNAVTANFVHSIDAAHLQMIALAAAKEGIEMVTVHDCFGCLAPQAKRLNRIIREQFKNLHERHNWLNEVRESARRDGNTSLPPLPETGNAEIGEILDSFHAFK